ncbi:hypothetical protein BN14_08974 [Rhizoctonia solani AG-1 IB]|uniref:Uncharacterized protein n=1 Tax=Thanatephorus cucumeris (strain AG1-IB / isolate 7/3/14) TaxID=1108050 RepID=M5C6X8_THACB|nr:hypothetical protein BN14_08974 [Rhizoctonia solani AG-1 IB]
MSTPSPLKEKAVRSPQKRPQPKPKRQPTLEPTSPPKANIGKSKGAGSSSTPSIKVLNTPVKAALTSNKLKKPTADNINNNIINLISDDDGEFVNKYIKKNGESHMQTVTFMHLKRKIQQLEGQLEGPKNKIRELQLQIMKLENKKMLHAQVEAELVCCAQQPGPLSSASVEYFPVVNPCNNAHIINNPT